MSRVVGAFIIAILGLSYFYGGYQLFTGKQYSSKQLIGGIILPPYTVYIGISDFFTKESDLEKCINIESKKTVEEILGDENIKLLFDANLSRKEIVEVAVLKRDKDIQTNCGNI